jgi:hypothetical protein
VLTQVSLRAVLTQNRTAELQTQISLLEKEEQREAGQ